MMLLLSGEHKDNLFVFSMLDILLMKNYFLFPGKKEQIYISNSRGNWTSL